MLVVVHSFQRCVASIVVHTDATVLRGNGGIMGAADFVTLPTARDFFRLLQRGVIEIIHTHPAATLERFGTFYFDHLKPLVSMMHLLPFVYFTLAVSHYVNATVRDTDVHRIREHFATVRSIIGCHDRQPVLRARRNDRHTSNRVRTEKHILLAKCVLRETRRFVFEIRYPAIVVRV
uniref:Uncharacterized protein n=1 Tax=Anopheles quadriannulatus TaxID=34691 RepID=A0A182XT96_ANOQN